MNGINGSGTAVLALHFQHDVVEVGAFAPMAKETRVVERAKVVLARARATGVPVFYARVAFRSGYPDLVNNSALFSLVSQAGTLQEDKPGSAVVADLAPHEGDCVVIHRRVNPFYGSDLGVLLTAIGAKRLIMMGVATNFVVEAAARYASDAGYEVVVVGDCCSALTPEAHEASLATLRMLASVQTSDELMQAAPDGL